MISSALNGPSSCLWYDERSTKLLGEYSTWMKSCDMQDVNETSFIFVTSVHQSKQPLWWSLVHWIDHLAVCDMMRGPPSFLLSILHQSKAMICMILTVHHICVTSVHQSKQPLQLSLVHWMDHLAVCDMQDSDSTSYIFVTSVHQSSSPSDDLWCIEWTIQLFVIQWGDYQASSWVSYIIKKLWHAAIKQCIFCISNFSILVKWAHPVISGASNGSSDCLWYDELYA